MTNTPKHGGARPNSGPKPKSSTGERMKNRAMRWTDSGWSDVLLIGMDRVRELVAAEAKSPKKYLKNALPTFESAYALLLTGSATLPPPQRAGCVKAKRKA